MHRNRSKEQEFRLPPIRFSPTPLLEFRQFDCELGSRERKRTEPNRTKTVRFGSVRVEPTF